MVMHKSLNFVVQPICPMSFNLKASDFGHQFNWGVAIAAAQNEGAWQKGGRGASIWDAYAKRSGKIKGGATPFVACDFYHRYKDDLLLVKALGFKVFRFSIAWSRILPDGTGRINKEGVAFYHQVIDECLNLGLTPMVTLYHWDLPLALQKQGGWTSRMMLKWFSRFVTVCAEAYGEKVKHWLVLNEPMGFTSLGYMLGKHAPGKTGLSNFLPAIHHAAMAQAEGGRILREKVQGAIIGTTFSCSEVVPYRFDRPEDIAAARRMDILLNRLFIEPSLGRGYPDEPGFKLMDQIHLHNKAWKYTERLQFNFDFIGLQNYFPVVIKHNPLMPYIQASEVKAATRKVPHTAMGWEVNADSFYRIIKRFWQYGAVKNIMITENGAAFKDEWRNGSINDEQRINYFKQYLTALYKAKQEGIQISGYLVWTLMDNFEWGEGYKQKFGIVSVDVDTQLRTIKDSGHWWRNFLS
jgi:beta-glucosidase